MKDVESLPDSASLNVEQEVFIEEGGRVYTSIRVLDIAEQSEVIDRVVHRYREGYTKSYYNEEIADKGGEE